MTFPGGRRGTGLAAISLTMDKTRVMVLVPKRGIVRSQAKKLEVTSLIWSTKQMKCFSYALSISVNRYIYLCSISVNAQESNWWSIDLGPVFQLLGGKLHRSP